MQLPKRILVVVDPTADAQPAVERSALVARTTSARIELFVCAYDPLLAETRSADAASVAKSRALAGFVRAASRQLAIALGASSRPDSALSRR